MTERIARWTDDDVIEHAVMAIRNETFTEMTERWPDGVSDAMYIRAMMMGMQFQLEFLRDLMIDALSSANQWDADTTQAQHILMAQMLEFVREEGKLAALVAGREQRSES